MIDIAEISRSIKTACIYLLSIQSDSGLWDDYPSLPVGKSDEWITGFAGLALIDATTSVSLDLKQYLNRAARSLCQRERENGGWGYNDKCKPDTDSTSFAILFLNRMGFQVSDKSRRFILSRWSNDRHAFSTYSGPLGWGEPHWDVTPYAFLSLPKRTRESLLPGYIKGLNEHRILGGGWRSYWWSNNLYSTMITLEVSSITGMLDVTHSFHDFYDYMPESPFDIACMIGIGCCAHWPITIIIKYTYRLLNLQLENGSWRGSRRLRVTEPACKEPWLMPIGNCYVDHKSVVSTSLAIRVLIMVRCYLNLIPEDTSDAIH